MSQRGSGHDRQNLVGQSFSRWTVIEAAEPSRHQKLRWLCKCECGTTRPVLATHLKQGRTKSCGCHNSEVAAERSRQRNRKHGHTKRGSVSPEYSSWASMRARCKYPCVNDYQLYGGRGITVCERWESFEAFLEDMGPKPTPKHTIDRIDGDKGYSPDNCRWATPKEQRQNRRGRDIGWIA